jgi:crossover junction endodeoxyribonuclease RuvC
MTKILALDIASVTGYAFGSPHDKPGCGSVRFAARDASHNAILANAYDWFHEFTRWRVPDVLVLEALLPPEFARGRTQKVTNELLGGLHGVIRAAAYKKGIYNIEAVSVLLVRHHFLLGHFKRDRAKRYTVEKCRLLGWISNTDNNAADAAALWSYWCGKVDPKTAIRVSPLFQQRRTEA